MGSCSFSLHDLQCSLLCVFAEHQGTTHALWKRTLIKAERYLENVLVSTSRLLHLPISKRVLGGRIAQARHFNGQGRWPAKFAKFIFDLLKNDESNAEASPSKATKTVSNIPVSLESREENACMNRPSTSLCSPGGAEPNIVTQPWTALYDAHTEIACLMLGSMTPELHRQFEVRGKPVADYVLKIKGYVEQLERHMKANKKSLNAKGKNKGNGWDKVKKFMSLSPTTLSLLLRSAQLRMMPATTARR
ncbi:60S ribosomal protein L17-2-like protein [Tanacetum coccineum]